MTEKIRAQISASVDDELQFHEWGLLAKRLRGEPALRQTWECYHLIGDAMQDSLAPCNTRGFTAKVMAELEAENQPKYRGNRRAAGMAMAASVAIAAIGFAGYYEGAGPARDNGLSATSSFAAAGEHDVPWNRKPAAVQQQLNNLLISHTDYISSLRRQPMLPYLHVAAYGAPRKKSHPSAAVVHTVADESPH